MTGLRPFWQYYGGKARIAGRYPAPLYPVIVEPFAGAAGYSLRHYDRQIVLCEKYDRIAEIWRYLIRVTPYEILAIPYVEHVDDLPAWVPAPARDLVGFWMNYAVASPCVTMSSRIKARTHDGRCEGWTRATRERVASQVERIRHWRVIGGSYESLPNGNATWYIDPPYNNRAGSYYVHADVDFEHLAAWCRERRGQTIVCENEGATWLPFEPLLEMHGSRKRSRESIWLNHNHDFTEA